MFIKSQVFCKNLKTQLTPKPLISYKNEDTMRALLMSTEYHTYG